MLIDLGEIDLAVQQLAAARAIAEGVAPPLLRAWLAAAEGVGLGVSGERRAALYAFDNADALLPQDPIEPAPDFNRAKTGMLVDLAYAHAAAGDRDAALDFFGEAKRLAMQIMSDRQLRRLSGLILPA